jgi:uncharacterized protein
MRLNVGYLFNKSIGTSRQIPVNFATLKIDDLSLRDLQSNIKISRTREGLLLQVKVKAEVDTTCGRCLDDFYMPVSSEFEELYQFPSRHREETDLVVPQDGFIDLEPLYREYLFLAIPIKRLCKPDCKGLCTICGAKLNDTTCEHTLADGKPSVIIEGEETV